MAKHRKRKKAGVREPGGRLSRKKEHVLERRAMTEAEAKSVVIEARRRHSGLPDAYLDLTDAGRPNAGTTQGVMRLRGALSADQFQAAEWWLGRYHAYHRAIGTPGMPKLQIGEGLGDESAYAEWCRSCRESWAEIAATLRVASTFLRSPIQSAFDVILVRQQEMPHMEGDLRLGLNAIHKKFLSSQRRAA